MTSTDPIGRARTKPELRAERLGTALRGLATELVEERRKVAQLRREIKQLKAQLESRHRPQESERALGARPHV